MVFKLKIMRKRISKFLLILIINGINQILKHLNVEAYA